MLFIHRAQVKSNMIQGFIRRIVYFSEMEECEYNTLIYLGNYLLVMDE